MVVLLGIQGSMNVAKRLHRALRDARFRSGGLQALCYKNLLRFNLRVFVVQDLVIYVSDDDGFVRPRTGGSRGWKNLVTFESTDVD
jgi:hypothetical protein